MKSPTIKTYSLYSECNGNLLRIMQSRLLGKDLVCLAMRRGDAPYHSKTDYYFDALDLFHSNGCKVAFIEDRKFFYLTKHGGYSFKSNLNNSIFLFEIRNYLSDLPFKTANLYLEIKVASGHS